MDTFFHRIKQISKSIAMIISWTLFAILIIIIGFLAYYLISANIYATKGEKYEPKFSLYTIVSPSMEPNIKVYDVILNTKIDDPKDIKVGDVITFISTSNISNGMTVTHRVTSIIDGKDGLEFKTKGDNNLSEDTDTAKENNLLGKVVLKIPQLGRLQFFLSSKGGWLLVIICPALFIIINDIFKIIKLNKVKKKIDDVNGSNEDNQKIEMEAFRKEKIKDKLNKKELIKAKKIENDLKSLPSPEPVLLLKEPENIIEEEKEQNIEILPETSPKLLLNEPKKKKKKKKNNSKNKKVNNNNNNNKKLKNIFDEDIEEHNIFSDDDFTSYKDLNNNVNKNKTIDESNENSNNEESLKEIKKEFKFELPKLK